VSDAHRNYLTPAFPSKARHETYQIAPVDLRHNPSDARIAMSAVLRPDTQSQIKDSAFNRINARA
jgi:hypothetical protein